MRRSPESSRAEKMPAERPVERPANPRSNKSSVAGSDCCIGIQRRQWQQRFKEHRKEDIRGPGRDPDDRQKTNGRFEPSWIWLVVTTTMPTRTEDELDESLRIEWAKTRARSLTRPTMHRHFVGSRNRFPASRECEVKNEVSYLLLWMHADLPSVQPHLG